MTMLSAKQLGELVIKVRAETADAEAAMKRIDAAISQTSAGGKSELYELEKAASRVGVGFTSLGRLATRIGSTLTTKVTAPLVGAGAAAAKTAIDFLELKEKTKVSFETLLGSAGKAKKLMGEIYEFSKTTPFSQETFYTAAQQLLAMGFTAKETKKNLEAFTNAAIATGKGADGIDTLTRSFGKMQAAGKVTLENLNMVTEMGVPAIKILANQYGVTTEELYKMISAGEVLSEDALPKLLDGMQNGTKGVNGMTAAYGELASKMKNGTITGALDSLHSAWRNFALAVFDADTNEKQEDKVKRIVALLNEAKRVLNNLSKVFGSVTEGTNGFLDSITELTKRFADFLENTPEEELRKIGDAILFLAKAGPMFLMLGGALKVIGSAFRGVSGIAKIVDEAQKLKALGGVTGTIKKFGKAVGKMPGDISKGLVGISNLIRGFMGIPKVTYAAGSGIGAFISACSPLLVAIAAVVSVLVWLKRNWDLVVQTMSKFAKDINLDEKFKAIEDAFSRLAQTLGGEGGDMLQSLGDIFYIVGEVIMKNLLPVFALLAGAFDGILSAIAPLIDALGGVIKVVRGIVEVIAGLLTGDMERVKEGFSRIGEGIKQALESLSLAIGYALVGIVEGIGAFIIDVIESFTGADLSEIRDFGKNVIEGFKAGWEAFCSDPAGFVKGIWDAFVQGICDLFGIHSPAKNVEPYGRNIAEGLKNGWDSFVSNAGEWAKTLWDALQGGFRGLADGAMKAGSNLAKNIGNGVKKGKEWLQKAGKNLGEKVKGGVESAKENVRKAGTTLAEKAKAGVESLKGGLQKAGSTIGGAAQKGVSGVKSLMQRAGSVLGNATKSGVSGTKGLLQSAGSAIGNAAKSGVSSIVGLMRSVGSRFGLNLSGGVKGSQGSLRSAGSIIANSAKTAVTSVFSSARTWGSHLVSNLASGISGGISLVTNAARNVADKVKSILGHTVPEAGPLKDEMDWMPHMVDNLSSTLTKSSPKLLAAAAAMASEMQDTMGFDDFSATGAITKNLQVSAGSNLAGTMSQMLAVMQVIARRPEPDYEIVMDGNVVAGRLTNRIDRNMGKSNNRRSKGL